MTIYERYSDLKTIAIGNICIDFTSDIIDECIFKDNPEISLSEIKSRHLKHIRDTIDLINDIKLDIDDISIRTTLLYRSVIILYRCVEYFMISYKCNNTLPPQTILKASLKQIDELKRDSQSEHYTDNQREQLKLEFDRYISRNLKYLM